MGFLKKLFAIYNLYRSGELNSLLESIDVLKDKKKQINIQLKNLEDDIGTTKALFKMRQFVNHWGLKPILMPMVNIYALKQHIA